MDSQYGRAFALTLLPNEPAPPTVPARVASKLALYTPSKDLVDAYLGEIARGYGVDWLPEPAFSESAPGADGDKEVEVDNGGKDDDDGEEGGGGGPKEAPIALDVEAPGKERQASPKPPAKEVAAPSLPAPPAGPEKDAWAGTGTGKGNEDEELAKRFERLKNLR